MKAELLVRGGRVLDGTGAPSFPADLAIANGRIEHLGPGRLAELEATEVIDASGRIVAPGFIDLHSHGDLIRAWPSPDRLSLVEGRLAQGITTEILGKELACRKGKATGALAGRVLRRS